MASKAETLYQLVVNAVPATGAITYEALRDTLVAQGMTNVGDYVHEAKKRGAIKARLTYVDGQIIHTYERA